MKNFTLTDFDPFLISTPKIEALKNLFKKRPKFKAVNHGRYTDISFSIFSWLNPFQRTDITISFETDKSEQKAVCYEMNLSDKEQVELFHIVQYYLATQKQKALDDYRARIDKFAKARDKRESGLIKFLRKL